LLAEDATSSVPSRSASNADEYAESIQRLVAITNDTVIQKMAVDGGDVLTWFDLHGKGRARERIPMQLTICESDPSRGCA
jgi:hypothetical protein